MFYENIIIGAGPAGIQCGYLFEKYSINYIILEKNEICGSFFDNYPHSGKLISINKKNTGSINKDFNLRHDWNSLLNSENLLFTDYSDDYYPDKKDLVKYLNEYANKFNLKIKFNTNVEKIYKDNNIFKIKIVNSDIEYTCNKLIMATGLSKPVYPNIKLNIKDKIKHYADYPKDYFLDKNNLEEFKNKRVVIFGSGNAAYELANILNNYTSHIIIQGRNYKPLAMSTHYSGDIRSVYLPYMDTFLLKSLNAINYTTDLFYIEQKEYNDKYNIYNYNNNCIKFTESHNHIFLKNIDKVIYCTGWCFDKEIFDFDIELVHNNKFPKIKFNYESINISNLYFIGSLMHSNDYKISSGGFIHGFRYLISFFVNYNYNKIKSIIFSLKNIDDINFMTKLIIDRINTSSGLYQMFGFLHDIFYYDMEKKEITYLQNINNKLLFANIKLDIYFILTLIYGSKKLFDLKKIGEKFSTIGSEALSSLLHPVIEVYDNNNKLIEKVHLDEDLLAEFHNPELYHNRIYRLLKSYL